MVAPCCPPSWCFAIRTWSGVAAAKPALHSHERRSSCSSWWARRARAFSWKCLLSSTGWASSAGSSFSISLCFADIIHNSVARSFPMFFDCSTNAGLPLAQRNLYFRYQAFGLIQWKLFAERLFLPESSELFRNTATPRTADVIFVQGSLFAPDPVFRRESLRRFAARRGRQHPRVQTSRSSKRLHEIHGSDLNYALLRFVAQRRSFFVSRWNSCSQNLLKGDQFVNRVSSRSHRERGCCLPLVPTLRSLRGVVVEGDAIVVPAGSSGSTKPPRRSLLSCSRDWSQVHDELIPYGRKWPRHLSTPPSAGDVRHHNSRRPLCPPSSPTIARRHPT